MKLHVITPVKDSIELSLQTIDSVMASGLPAGTAYTVYNDRSLPQNRQALMDASSKMGFGLVHLEDITDNPSPNYLTVLRLMRSKCIEEGAHLCIVESDVTVEKDTIANLYSKASMLERCGLAAAVTVDDTGKVNYPYDKMDLPFDEGGDIPTRKHLSFCCTLLSNELLRAVDFDTFDDSKSWFDVTISRESLDYGLMNYACADLKVLHTPHGSRPWKQLKYTNKWKYYWLKWVIHRRDKI